jgi:hypothetical protein
VKNLSGSAASISSFAAWPATRTTSTSGFGTLGFPGSIRSFQAQTNPFILPLLSTPKPKCSSPSLVCGSDNAMRRTSSWVAIGPSSASGGAPRPHRVN